MGVTLAKLRPKGEYRESPHFSQSGNPVGLPVLGLGVGDKTLMHSSGSPVPVSNHDCPQRNRLFFPSPTSSHWNTKLSVASFWLESQERVLRTFQQVQANFL